MAPFLWQVLLHTPGWVYAMLAALIVLGLVQTRVAERSIAMALVPGAALAGWSAWTMHALFPLAPSALLAWVVGVAAVQPIGARLLPAPTWLDATRRRLRIPGSWLPLGMILGVFGVRYVDNVVSVIRPDLMVDPTFAAASGLVAGVLGGLFVSRLAQVVRVVRGTAAGRAGAPSAAPVPQALAWMWSRTRG